MSTNKNKYLIKNMAIFAISIFATKIIYFILVPLYTKCLTPSEYGIVDLLFTITNFIFPIFTLNITEAIYRFSMDKDSNFNRIISIGFLCFVICIVCSLILIPAVNLFSNYSDYSLLFYLYVISVAFFQIVLSLVKGQEKLKLFSFGNIIASFLIAIFNILLLLVFNMKIEGYFLSYILANFITGIFVFVSAKYYSFIKKIELDKALFKKMTKYSVVLIPTSFLWWIINSSDRIMIANILGNYENGIYAISYKIPSLLTTNSFVFTQAWVFSAIKNINEEDNEQYTNKIFDIFIKLLCIAGILIILVIKPLFKIYVTPVYYTAWKFVPFLVFGYVFMTAATFVSTSYNVKKDSKGFLYSGAIGAFINIILNLILIPKFWIYGAAFATMLSYISVFVYRLIDTKKYLKLRISKIQILYVCLLLLSCIIIYFKSYVSYLLILIIIIISVIVSLNDLKELFNNLVNIIKNKKNEKRKLNE